MRRFFIILSLIIFTTNSSFAACAPGYHEGMVSWPTVNGSSYGYYKHDGSDKYNYTSPVALSAGEWSVTWTSGNTTGTAHGYASCNTTIGVVASSSGSSNSMSKTTNGQYCWCKVVDWNTIDVVSSWVYIGERDVASECAKNCAGDCAYHVRYYADRRSAVFGAVSSICVACPAKPEGATWTTGCNFACSAGTYQSFVTSSVTFPTTDGTGSTYNGSSKTWSVTWSNDTVSGTSGCSSSSSSYTSSGQYCWCKLTSWNSSSLNASWIYAARLSSSTCSWSCASSCASKMNSDSTFRSNSFNSVTNTPTVTTSTCPSCPSGGTSSAGATAITQCYVPTTTEFTDAVGTYHYSSNCYYTN